ncbi:hypothetical protein BN948_01770 [Hydrogenophaga intermedia]|uniref:DUF1376 domain-containing protein n=1 Tax=Hydrogenophaga intermedia TaxID=65786 RepID=A0A1L1PBI7_HYDIT|nr:hypothetical protein [Hydrogenophaga intermedia]CDN87348.1 hypothetical protein BN948_01770 [Hydrogenophaga intermedia]
MSETLPPPPYPADTKSKGWRFELDLEQLTQSDTWALAGPLARPWLLMLWTTAWQQQPCGALTDDDEIIAARVGMPLELFQEHRKVLMRGWAKASDGRLYHPIITQRVLAMMGKRDAEKIRKANYRARQAASHPPAESREEGGSPPMSHGTTEGRTQDSGGSDATRTSTSTRGIGIPPLEAKDQQNSARTEARASVTEVSHGTEAGRACFAMRKAGLMDANPAHPTLLALLTQGMSTDELVAAAQTAVGKGKGFAYALSVAEGRRRDAATVGSLPAVQIPADLARTTVPGRQGKDPTLAALDRDDALATRPSAEVRAKMAELLGKRPAEQGAS